MKDMIGHHCWTNVIRFIHKAFSFSNICPTLSRIQKPEPLVEAFRISNSPTIQKQQQESWWLVLFLGCRCCYQGSTITWNLIEKSQENTIQKLLWVPTCRFADGFNQKTACCTSQTYCMSISESQWRCKLKWKTKTKGYFTTCRCWCCCCLCAPSEYFYIFLYCFEKYYYTVSNTSLNAQNAFLEKRVLIENEIKRVVMPLLIRTCVPNRVICYAWAVFEDFNWVSVIVLIIIQLVNIIL